jgi:hypothetical protein
VLKVTAWQVRDVRVAVHGQVLPRLLPTVCFSDIFLRYDRDVRSHHEAIDGINIANGLPDMRSVQQVGGGGWRMICWDMWWWWWWWWWWRWWGGEGGGCGVTRAQALKAAEEAGFTVLHHEDIAHHPSCEVKWYVPPFHYNRVPV